jgi:hypothetical protein
MAFPTPDETAVSTETANPTETEPETTFGGNRDDDYEDYWAICDAYRGIKKMCLTHLFDGDKVSNRTIEDKAEVSPLAEHFVFYKEQKDGIKATLKERRANDELPKGASLPAYREEFETPDFDHDVLTADNADEWGLTAGVFRDDEDAIFVPEAYEPPMDDDGNLIVYHSQDTDGPSLEAVLAAAAETDGIGEKTLENLKENIAGLF